MINEEMNTPTQTCTRPQPRTVYKIFCTDNIKISFASDFSFLAYQSIRWCDPDNEHRYECYNMFTLDSTKKNFPFIYSKVLL